MKREPGGVTDAAATPREIWRGHGCVRGSASLALSQSRSPGLLNQAAPWTRGLNPGRTGQEADGTLISQVPQTRQGFGDALILKDHLQGRRFGKGVGFHFEVV